MRTPVRATHLLFAGLALVASAAAVLAAQPGTATLLISAQQLAREIKDPSLVVLHVGPKDDYDAGHVPGARLVLPQDLAATPTPGAPTLELPDAADLRARLEKLGVGDRSTIIVVAGADWASPSTRVVWTLQAAGLGARTRWLDGGNEGWKRAGLAVSKDVPTAPAPGTLTLPEDRSVVVDHAWVQSRLGTPGFRLLDARVPAFYEGAGMTDSRGVKHAAGHIPGARNVPFNTLFNDSLQLRPRDVLQRIFTDAGVQQGDTVVAYCHIGQQATVVLFAARLLGHPVKLYDGSFTDWDARKLPIENPTAPREP
jgi:thiosulfate/3-mercaptopyruvate sulfurtransferase